jgi:hypothetical protein
MRTFLVSQQLSSFSTWKLYCQSNARLLIQGYWLLHDLAQNHCSANLRHTFTIYIIFPRFVNRSIHATVRTTNWILVLRVHVALFYFILFQQTKNILHFKTPINYIQQTHIHSNKLFISYQCYLINIILAFQQRAAG